MQILHLCLNLMISQSCQSGQVGQGWSRPLWGIFFHRLFCQAFYPLKVMKIAIKKHASSHLIPARPQISFSDPQLYAAFCWTPSFFPDRQYNHDQERETFANCTHLHYAIQRRFLERLSEASKRN